MKPEESLEKIRMLFRIANLDPQYSAMSVELAQLETAFGDLVNQLPEDAQNIAWGFVCVSEQMNWRMLELICERFQIDPVQAFSASEFLS